MTNGKYTETLLYYFDLFINNFLIINNFLAQLSTIVQLYSYYD